MTGSHLALLAVGICIAAEGLVFAIRRKPIVRRSRPEGNSWWTREMSPRAFTAFGSILVAFGALWIVIAFL